MFCKYVSKDCSSFGRFSVLFWGKGGFNLVTTLSSASLQCQVLSVRSLIFRPPTGQDRLRKTGFAHLTDAVPYISTTLVVFQWKMDFWTIDRSI